MKSKNEVLKKKAATYSISRMTEERIDSIGTEVLGGGVVADHLEEIFQTINERVFKKWQNEKLEKIVSLIGALKVSSKSRADWKEVVEDGLGVDSKFFYHVVETLGLESEDVKIFVWECSNITQKKKSPSHRNYERKHKTYTLYENTENLLRQIQNILGENKSNTFQFVVLLYFYLKWPYSKYRKAKLLLDSYMNKLEGVETFKKDLEKPVAKLKELLDPSDADATPMEMSVSLPYDFDWMEKMDEELNFTCTMLEMEIELLKLMLSQIDDSD